MDKMPDSIVAALGKSFPSAGSLGNGAGLANATEHVVMQEVLVGQQFNQTEQHVYGSKRLGIQTNLAYPGQWYWKQSLGGYIPPSNIAINPRIPWNSLALNDLMLSTTIEPLQGSRDYGY